MRMMLGTMNSTIHAVRHGKTEANEHNETQNGNRHFGGQADSKLSPKGEQQATDLGLRYRDQHLHFSRIISSPLSRAKRTAELIRAAMGVKIDIEERAGLKERSLGPLEGRTVQELLSDVDFMEANPIMLAHLQRDPDLKHLRETFEPSGIEGVESYADVTKRILEDLEDVFTVSEDPECPILIVSHKHTTRCLLHLTMCLPQNKTLGLDVPNASPIIIPMNTVRNSVRSLLAEYQHT